MVLVIHITISSTAKTKGILVLPSIFRRRRALRQRSKILYSRRLRTLGTLYTFISAKTPKMKPLYPWVNLKQS